MAGALCPSLLPGALADPAERLRGPAERLRGVSVASLRDTYVERLVLAQEAQEVWLATSDRDSDRGSFPLPPHPMRSRWARQAPCPQRYEF